MANYRETAVRTGPIVSALCAILIMLPDRARAEPCPYEWEFCPDFGVPYTADLGSGGKGCEFCLDGGGGKDAGAPGSGGKDSGPAGPPPPPNPCWDSVLQIDICNTPPKDPCPPEKQVPLTFVDDLDGQPDGQIMARADHAPHQSCAKVLTQQTGYYRLYDKYIAESCATQLDETGYLTVKNTCNGAGWATEANAGDRYLVLDSDNTNPCTGDGQCGAGMRCRLDDQHSCCVPLKPVYLGTFYLVAGEPNLVCINHWCPEWKAGKQQMGKDFGFVKGGCVGANSVHFILGGEVVACKDDTMLNPCTFGCSGGKCLPDPCAEKNCPAYCKNGKCLEQNPCAGLNCKRGCKNGRCLQPPSTPGVDQDGDGFPYAADCDDSNALVNPNRPEICGNGLDDNCDGWIDEASCQNPSGGGGVPGSSAPAGDGGPPLVPGSGESEVGPSGGLGGGCTGCALADSLTGAELSLLTLVLLLAWRFRP
jgi:hypothetical protein